MCKMYYCQVCSETYSMPAHAVRVARMCGYGYFCVLNDFVENRRFREWVKKNKKKKNLLSYMYLLLSCLVAQFSNHNCFLVQCSVPCGGGDQSRPLSCVRLEDVSAVEDTLCEGQPRPVHQRPCYSQPCAQWTAAKWSEVGLLWLDMYEMSTPSN